MPLPLCRKCGSLSSRSDFKVQSYLTLLLKFLWRNLTFEYWKLKVCQPFRDLYGPCQGYNLCTLTSCSLHKTPESYFVCEFDISGSQQLSLGSEQVFQILHRSMSVLFFISALSKKKLENCCFDQQAPLQALQHQTRHCYGQYRS